MERGLFKQHKHLPDSVIWTIPGMQKMLTRLLMKMERQKIKNLMKPDVKQDTVEKVNGYPFVL